MIRPPEIITTTASNDQCFFSSLNKRANPMMKMIAVDFVIVYLNRMRNFRYKFTPTFCLLRLQRDGDVLETPVG